MSAPPISDSDALDAEPSNREHASLDNQGDGVVSDEVAPDEAMGAGASDATALDATALDAAAADDTAMEAEAAAPQLPDRANAPVSVVTERFLRAILTYVPLDRIVELHLFSPLRQGGVETGIAVIAADIEVTEPVEGSDALELALDPPIVDADATGTPADAEQDADAMDQSVSIEMEIGDVVSHPVHAEATPERESVQLSDDDDEASPYADEEPALEEPVQALDETANVAEEHALTSDETLAPTAFAPAPPVRHIRHTVYTARYRLVLKGPERGKWETDVVNEADAPLLTVETVVRGVQRRAGEATDTVRYDAAQIAKALRTLLPATNA